MTRLIRRREFVEGLSAAAAVWPGGARAQQDGRMRSVGILSAGPTGSLSIFEAPLRKGLSEMGYVEGRNLALEYRYAQNQMERLPDLATDLIRGRVEVIVTLGSDAVAAAAKTTTTMIPIVFEIGGDPVESKLVVSLNRPGNNLTGVTSMNAELSAKRLGLLHELLPQARRFANLVQNSPITPSIIKSLENAASRIGVQIDFFHTNNGLETESAFANIKKAAVVVNAGPPLTDHVAQVVTLATRHALPTIYPGRQFTETGGLMSYASTVDRVRQIGIYVGRILKGEKPADLPVVQPTKFEFVINLQTARAFDIEVPPTLLATADEVIE